MVKALAGLSTPGLGALAASPFLGLTSHLCFDLFRKRPPLCHELSGQYPNEKNKTRMIMLFRSVGSRTYNSGTIARAAVHIA